MNAINHNKLIEITKLLNKAQGLLSMVIEAHPKQPPEKPQRPHYRRRAELELWNVWDKLKAKGQFTANQAKEIAKENLGANHPLYNHRTASSYSSILSRWAEHSHIIKVEEGSGQKPAIYEIQN